MVRITEGLSEKLKGTSARGSCSGEEGGASGRAWARRPGSGPGRLRIRARAVEGRGGGILRLLRGASGYVTYSRREMFLLVFYEAVGQTWSGAHGASAPALRPESGFCLGVLLPRCFLPWGWLK